ncbi:glutathione S-transferase N-terminal domain-containing protein [Candidatus Wolfebacteria bacterium]|nr:glutathione S-transferase N-terminal domain-containing protein [Candidatus Wolfebacteria bacterium]
MIKIYTTLSCPYCQMAKEFFKQKGMDYEEFNVAENEAAREEMMNKSHQLGVPVIDINGAIIVGFNRSEVEKALAS